MIKASRVAALLTAFGLSASTASAQGWVTMANGGPLGNVGSNTASPTRAYWNNGSDDKTATANGCNIGYILTGDATTANCLTANQRPAGWLPFTGTAPSSFLASGSNGQTAGFFMLQAGLYDISVLGLGRGGNVAGNSQNWGVFSTGSIQEGGASLGNLVNLNVPGTTFSRVFNFTSSWGLWINSVDLGNIFSNGSEGGAGNARNFGLFSAGPAPALVTAGGVTTVGFTSGSPMYFGLEDRTCRPGGPAAQGQFCTNSDFDLNDVVGRITAVPEPSTYLLMATGLVAVAGMARRRRRVA